jgi:hypothetical protein
MVFVFGVFGGEDKLLWRSYYPERNLKKAKTCIIKLQYKHNQRWVLWDITPCWLVNSYRSPSSTVPWDDGSLLTNRHCVISQNSSTQLSETQSNIIIITLQILSVATKFSGTMATWLVGSDTLCQTTYKLHSHWSFHSNLTRRQHVTRHYNRLL